MNDEARHILIQTLISRTPIDDDPMQVFPHSHSVDARHSLFQEIHGNLVISDSQQATKANQIYRWLSVPDPSANQDDAYKKRQDSTGTWFTDGEAFNNWKNDPWSFILLFGMPGCGKTVLSSSIIHEVACHCSREPSLALAYFYFDFNDAKKQIVRSLICSLVTQFSRMCTSIPKALAALYAKCLDGQHQPSTTSLMKVLRNVVTSFRHAYIVLDALDECTEQDDLLSFIEEITDWKLDNMHILATSRPDRMTNECLASRTSGTINLQSAIVDVDIQFHVRERLQKDFPLRKWSSKVKEEIETSLMEGANGMFRWVICQLEVLRKCVTVEALRRTLKTLPKSLDETYDRILSNIDEQHSDYAHKVLQWLAFSARPVMLAEVADALTVSLDHGCLLEQDQQLEDPHDILTICSSLVMVARPVHLDGKDKDILRLAHFSVKEYLISTRIRLGPAAQYTIMKRQADTMLSQTCLVYLAQFDKIDVFEQRSISSFPLAGYAAQFWVSHAKSDDGDIPDIMQTPIANFLEPNCAKFVNWVRLYDFDHEWRIMNLSQSPEFIAPSLYYASILGLEKSLLHLLLDHRAAVNEQGGQYGNALQAASYQGHESVVKILLENGAEVNAQGGEYGNALQAASWRGHEGIVQLLLDNRAEVNAQGGQYGNALQAASWTGYKGTVQLLPDNRAEVNIQGGEYENALQAASWTGHEGIVQLLLDHRAEVNAQGGVYGNALQAASRGGHEGIVQLLLDNRAEVNAQGGQYGNALQAASIQGYEGIVQLLLDNGAEVNAQEGQLGLYTVTVIWH